jgi:hypothetical protein
MALLMLVMGLAPSIWLPSIETGVHPRSSRVVTIDAHFLAQGGQR